VLYCAHCNKETKFSQLNSQESVGVSIDFTSREKGGVESNQVEAEIESSQKEGYPP
jgi:hypothetical protein